MKSLFDSKLFKETFEVANKMKRIGVRDIKMRIQADCPRCKMKNGLQMRLNPKKKYPQAPATLEGKMRNYHVQFWHKKPYLNNEQCLMDFME